MALPLVRRPLLATTTKLYHHCTIARVRAISAVSFRWFSSVARIDARHADGAVLPHTGAKTAQVILSPRPTAAPPRKPEPVSTSAPPAPPVQSR